MSDTISGVPGAAPDAHGEAALLLVESLIHGLVARSALSVDEAVDLVKAAMDAQLEIADYRGGEPAALSHAGRLLSEMARSLAIDTKGTD